MKRGRPKLNRKNCRDCNKRLDGNNKSYCKKCTLYNHGRQASHLRKDFLERDKEYQRNKRETLEGYKTEEYREWREKNPEKYEAYKKFQNIRKKIKKSPCVDCGRKSNIHGHHPDYSKPYEVIWVCPIHHKNYHLKPIVVMVKINN